MEEHEEISEETSDYLNRVFRHAEHENIVCYKADELKPCSPSNANADVRGIIVNMNWPDKQQLPYQAAHEVKHIELEHHGVCYFDGRDISGQEGAANRGAVDMLVGLYFADRSMESANPYQFMAAFSIPNSMYDYVCDSICNFYD
jgi:hypothetical protein